MYDVTEFMHQHPGMASALKLFGGDDATAAFREVPHSSLAHRLMRSLEVPGLSLPPEDFPPRLEQAEPPPSQTRLEDALVALERLRTWVPSWESMAPRSVVPLIRQTTGM